MHFTRTHTFYTWYARGFAGGFACFGCAVWLLWRCPLIDRNASCTNCVTEAHSIFTAYFAAAPLNGSTLKISEKWQHKSCGANCKICAPTHTYSHSRFLPFSSPSLSLPISHTVNKSLCVESARKAALSTLDLIKFGQQCAALPVRSAPPCCYYI